MEMIENDKTVNIVLTAGHDVWSMLLLAYGYPNNIEKIKELILEKSKGSSGITKAEYQKLIETHSEYIPEIALEKINTIFNSLRKTKLKGLLVRELTERVSNFYKNAKKDGVNTSVCNGITGKVLDLCINIFITGQVQNTQNDTDGFIEGYAELLHCKEVKNMYYGHDKIMNTLKKIPLNGEPVNIKEKDKIMTIVSFDVNAAAKEANVDLKGFTRFDIDVLNGVASLTQSGNWYFTQFQLFEVITRYSIKKMSPKWSYDIHASMKKWRMASGDIDITEAVKLYPKLESLLKELSTDTVLINWESYKQKTRNGSETVVYHIFRTPILFAIAEAKGHVSCYDIRHLKASTKKGNERNSIESILLKNYMLEWVQQRVKNPKKFQNYKPTMLLSTLYSEFDSTSTAERRSTRDNLKKILQEMKEAALVQDYEFLPVSRPSKVQFYLYDNKQLFLDADYKEMELEKENNSD